MNNLLTSKILKIDGIFTQFREAAQKGDDSAMLKIMSNYGTQMSSSSSGFAIVDVPSLKKK